MEFFNAAGTWIVGAWHAVRAFLFSLFYEMYFAQALLVLVILFFPHILFAVRRIRLLSKIKRCTKRLGYTFCAHRKFYFLGNFKHAECEFSIVSPHRAWAVKLLGTRSKSHHVRILSETDLELVKSGRLGPNTFAAARRARLSRYANPAVKWYPHPAWEFYTYAERDLQTECILLCSPKPGVVALKRPRAAGGHDLISLSDNMRVFDMTFHTEDGFLKELERESAPSYHLYTE